MSTELEHRSEFVNDTEKILDRLNKLLTSKTLSIPKIYREVHSLKGAAGFAGLINMEHLAHSLEGFLTGIRDGEICLNEEIERFFYKAQDYFIKDIKYWKQESEELDVKDVLESIEKRSFKIKPISIEVVNENESSGNFFTDFEQTLLKEAMYRGEQFYRIICHIDSDEEMKYPRLFLVINNLENISNVIKIHPPMSDISSNQIKTITVYLTSDKSKSFIYKGLSFDRIREVEFIRLEYSSFFTHNFELNKSVDSNLYGKTIDVETSKIEEIFNYSQDLHNRLLLEDLVVPSKKHIVEELLTGMKNSLNSLTTITIDNAFSYFNSYCNKLGKELGKQIEFRIDGGDLSIERQLAEVLKEVLIQLVKNSIDHGIENADERILKGKSVKGLISLKVVKLKGSLAITLKDDGRGINKNDILNKGIEGHFIDKDENISLLSLLSRPGFSTSKEVNYYSGRGVGLDLVVNRIVNKLDGKIKIDINTDEGMAFHILIPPSNSIKKYTLFKYKNSSFAFSMINIVEKLTLNTKAISLGENLTLNYSHNNVVYPIYTPNGRLSSSSASLDEKYGFIIRYLGKKAFFPVEEFILEKEFFSSVLTFLDTEIPNLKKVKVGEKLEDFTFILPSIINC